PGQTDATLLAGRQRMAGYILEAAQADAGQRLADLLRAGRGLQGAQPGEILFCGEQTLDAGGVADPEQAGAGLGRTGTGQRLTVEQNLAVARLHQAAEQAQKTGLATAVGPGDLQHLAGAQRKGQVLEERSSVALAT